MACKKELSDRDFYELINAMDSDFEFSYLSDSDSDDEIKISTANSQKPVVDILSTIHKKSTNLIDVVMSEDIIDEQAHEDITETEQVEFIDKFNRYVVTDKKQIEFRRRCFSAQAFDFEPEVVVDNASETFPNKRPLYK